MKHTGIPLNIFFKNHLFIIFLVALFSHALLPGVVEPMEQETGSAEHRRLEYDITVRLLGTPFVALDLKGRPVFDLKKEELELYVNGKLTPIYSLSAFNFGAGNPAAPARTAPLETGPVKTKSIKTGLKSPRKLTIKQPHRLNVIVVDSVFNSSFGMAHAKKIVRELISHALPGDRFLLLQIELGGLKYLAGPVAKGDVLMAALEKLRKTPHKISNWLPYYSGRLHEQRKYFGPMGALDIDLSSHAVRHSKDVSVQTFQEAFKQLNRALRSLSGPKITYLFTEGFFGYLDDDRSGTNFRLVTKNINNKVYDGGSVFKKVWLNGMRPSHIKNTARRLANYSSAYYELFYYPGPDSGHRLNLEIKCKRKNVRINAAKFRARDLYYRHMSVSQKKSLALRTVCGLAPSGSTLKSRLFPFEILGSATPGSDSRFSVKVVLPPQFRNLPLDVFLVRLDSNFSDAEISMKTKSFRDAVVFNIRASKEKSLLYFAVIDPAKGYCIFNKIR